jgi:hypothetical protein
MGNIRLAATALNCKHCRSIDANFAIRALAGKLLRQELRIAEERITSAYWE